MYKIRYSYLCRLCHIKVNSAGLLIKRNNSNERWMIHELDPAYVPHKVETDTSTDNYFRTVVKNPAPFSLVLPPPNITGTLHLGHALTAAVEDTLVKWKQMQGIETVWVPGMDHAGIATQVVVEKKLWKEEGKSRHDIGREEFEKKVWKWKAEKGDVIGKQLRRLGCSLDWRRELFTMDKDRSKAVQTAFIRLFDEGLIYRSDHLVNWSCVLQSAISDIEVEHLSLNGPTHIEVPGYSNPVEFGLLFRVAYKIHGSDDEIVVATTRPETIPGDVAIAVHPKDERYNRWIGKAVWHPFRNEAIPVIADEFVDPQFGTGAVKITPAHDQSDFEVSKRHQLQSLKVIDETGCLTYGEFQGIPRFQARTIIVDRLAEMGLMRGKESHPMTVPICSRSKDVIELLVKPQWFINCRDMATLAVSAVKEGELKIHPKRFEKTWFAWLENIRDWCISRQLWWGHQIPAYSYHLLDQPSDKKWVAAEDEAAALAKAMAVLGVAEEEIVIQRDEDVLDTWFSSALQPLSAFGWPKKAAPDRFYPLSLMETGHDILFFWVARMVMLGTHLTGQLPFKEILLHGIICDSHGRKMSKSLGNIIAPDDVIDGITSKVSSYLVSGYCILRYHRL
ncbi:unnamed protein product [Acanthoscelides obtectus]|uniref:valine--tRNA ligase n=1 Tax=Acanthoscelides obtectus TaxID=200917 RepID=A0A9P0P1R5_ACAOB|nr:unnamed protein product [Acanthoscelides obtectus]CAK1652942.1 Valine--tRNA ligase [Acanthoscelides obtectus]